jgi:signal transduction histidine kinase
LAASWAAAALALTLAIGSGVLLTELMMSPPGDELRTMAGYLTLSAVMTAGIGWLALRLGDRAFRPTLRTRAFLSSAAAGAVALLNVIIVAQLMFLSTEHDLKLLIALVVFSAFVTALFSFWVAATVAGRIEEVAAAIRLLAQGDFTTRLEDGGGDEVARLVEDVNALAIRLKAAQEERSTLDRERKELTAAVSHDLRTPLSSLRAMTEALSDGVIEDPQEVRRYYGTMRREIERLSRMIDDLFELAQMDAGALRLNRQRVSLQEIAAEVVDAMQAPARLAGVDLSLNVAGWLPEVSVDGARIERALANLVRNALEHTQAAGRITVSVESRNGHVELTVTDTGDGIDAADLPRVWGRFYRAEKSRRRSPGNVDGAGLGLAIVRGIAESHGGSVHAESTPAQGSAFSLRLPLN